DSDVAAVLQKFREKVFPTRLSVGIWGIRSEFRGSIFDIPGTKSQQYSSKANVLASYRPCYMLLIGNRADVLALAGEIAAKAGAASSGNFILLSPEVL